jgi:hypothetical protein
MTKSSAGALADANSLQLLLRKPCDGTRAASSCRSASGRTRPDGWLPALNARKPGDPLWFVMASAMIERAELAVHKKSTL